MRRRSQTYHRGDLVRLADKFPSSMGHFKGRGQIVEIVGSYQDQYGRGGFNSHSEYTVKFKNGLETSWYPESLMVLVEERMCYRCGGHPGSCLGHNDFCPDS